jgi:hypothetical protein
MARSSKDLARRLRFDPRPRSDTFRRWYWLAGIVVAVAGLGVWIVLHQAFGRRQYLPGPVSQAHAIFGAQCEKCHDQFHRVSNDACLVCHGERIHSTNEPAGSTPACAHCHVEHRGVDVFLAVSATACVECHAALKTAKPKPDIEAAIATFAAHPTFVPLRPGYRDAAKLRFNHQIHLTSNKIAAEERPLRCAKCHQPDAGGRLMQPIVFETHCRRCHQQAVTGPAGSIEAPHATPEVIHEDLRRQLLDIAVTAAATTRKSLQESLADLAVPNPELLYPKVLLPDRQERRPFDVTRLRVSVLERDLYQPLRSAETTTGATGSASLLDLNKYCFLCHVEDGARSDPEELPRIAATEIARRWLRRGEFSHRRHEKLPCEHCHKGVRDSRDTAGVNLPDNALCRDCHRDNAASQSAGTNCMLCHLYHDTSIARVHPPATPSGTMKPASRQVGIACLQGGDCRTPVPTPTVDQATAPPGGGGSL